MNDKTGKGAAAVETPAPVVINGWSVFAHPLFLDQLDALIERVEVLRKKDPIGYTGKNATKRLAAITKLAFEVVPQDPTRPEYRQGVTLGDAHKHWFRAKFFQQYRLFFRYDLASHVIVFAWVNDEYSKRAYGSADDAYCTFRRMLDSGHPPDDWAKLLAEAKRANERLQETGAKLSQNDADPVETLS